MTLSKTVAGLVKFEVALRQIFFGKKLGCMDCIGTEGNCRSSVDQERKQVVEAIIELGLDPLEVQGHIQKMSGHKCFNLTKEGGFRDCLGFLEFRTIIGVMHIEKHHPSLHTAEQPANNLRT